MEREHEVGPRAVGGLRALRDREVDVAVARQHDAHREPALDLDLELAGERQREILLDHVAHRHARVAAAVAGIERHDPERARAAQALGRERIEPGAGLLRELDHDAPRARLAHDAVGLGLGRDLHLERAAGHSRNRAQPADQAVPGKGVGELSHEVAVEPHPEVLARAVRDARVRYALDQERDARAALARRDTRRPHRSAGRHHDHAAAPRIVEEA